MALISFLLSLAALIAVLMVHARLKQLEDGTLARVDGLKERVQQLEKKTFDQKRQLDALAHGAEQPEPSQAKPARPIQAQLMPSPPVAPVEPELACSTGKPAPAVVVHDQPRVAPASAAAPPRPQALPAPPAQAPPLPPPSRPTPPQPTVPVTPPAAARSFDWESLIGVKLFSWIAGIALVIAGLFFLRYSIEQGWLQPPVRMAIGIIVSLALLILCELRVARQYRVTANSLDAAAVAILFSTFYAAYARWSLIGVTTAFGLLALVAAVAVLLAIRRDSLFIALLGLVGAFATPALVSTGQDHSYGLFGYLLILDVGLSWVAYRKTWPHLVALSLVFTTIYQWSWVLTFLTAARLPLAAAIFLVFAALGVVALAIGQSRSATDSRQSLFARLAAIGICLPLIFALYLAAVPAYAAHAGLLFGFLLTLDVALFGVAATRGSEWLHVAGGATTPAVMWIWISSVYPAAAGASVWFVALLFVVLFVALYLAGPVAAARFGRPFVGSASHAVLAAPVLLFVFPSLAGAEPACAEPWLLFGVLFVLLAAIAWAAVVGRRGTLHYIAAFLALSAEAVWSAKYLTPDRLPAALILYGVFGLFYLAVPLVARRTGRPFRPAGAAGILLLVSLSLLFFLAQGSMAPASLWGMALLLAVLNLALLIEGSASRAPLVAAAGSILSWLVIAFWWVTAPVGTMLVPAMAVVAGFTMLTLGGQIWLARGLDEADAASPRAAMFLGLVGHLFLLFVASRPELAVPPWPMFGVLAVLDLAVGAAALHSRRGELHVAAVVATQLILITWAGVAVSAPWPTVSIIASGACVAFACVWVALAGRLRLGTRLFDAAVVAAVVMGQLVVLGAGLRPGAPGVGTLVASHVALIVVLLTLAARRQRHQLAIVAVILPALSVAFWQGIHARSGDWLQILAFASAIYLTFVLYPLVLGKRVAAAIGPYQAAVAAGIPFFLVARPALYQGGFGGIIGALPLAQAALTAAHLVQLLRLEQPGTRRTGRLALVAGTALAYLTLAVPLQLEKEWITIAWVLEGAALAWLYVKIPHRGLYWWAVALLSVVFVRLALNPEVLVYQPRGSVRIWNWYLYTYAVAAASMLAAARSLVKVNDATVPGLPRASTLLKAAGTILLFLLLNIEIADFFATGETITFNFSATLVQDLTYTLGWGVFGVGLLALGIVLKSHPARVAALGLLVVTVLKCFLHDLARLTGLYRVASFVGLAICLALVAVVLQRFVLAKPPENRP
jgi:uncharacterized membrane protein